MTFKKGDMVRCVDNKGVERKLELGEVYTVLAVSAPDNVSISVDPEYHFRSKRFELVNPESQYIGQRVMVRDVEGEEWEPRILVAVLPRGKRIKYIVVIVGHEGAYWKGNDYNTISYKQMKPIPETVTIKIGDFEKEVTACDAEKIKAYAEGVEG